PTRYRVAAELEGWKLKDPIERVRAYMFKNQIADQDFFDTIDAEADELGRDVRKRCLALPDPEPLAIFDHVYAEPHSLMDAERAEFATYLEGFEA
ncbi:pyruvate dehydrogenase (acetyl-transferring) E1 component subunit alpha, partial [Streptosporangium sp. NPDC001682]